MRFNFFSIMRIVLTSACLAGSGCSNLPKEKPGAASALSDLGQKPDIIVILTDQERYQAHWPSGWAEKHLPSTMRLRQHGLTFHRAYTAASECSPSRAVLVSGEHYPTNGVGTTPPSPGLPAVQELMNIGALLQEKAGYDVIWKGKWHLSNPVDGRFNWSEQDIENLKDRYDFAQWNPPDAGDAILQRQPLPGGGSINGLDTLGGGYAKNDARFVQGAIGDAAGFGQSVLEYLGKTAKVAPDQRKPFCLFVSLVNPHDVWVYPTSWKEAGYQREEFVAMGINLPENFADDLTTKPSVQLKARQSYDQKAPLIGSSDALEYVNFYAYLHTVVDQQIQAILNALETLGLLQNTLIIRTADHGELGLSHGMREKAYTAYEEMIHIPFIVSNPKLYPTAQSTDAFYCHLDLMPTLAELAGIPNFSSYGKGVSIVPVLKDPSANVQDSILFTYDDMFFLPEDVPGGHIRAIREGDWTYAVYYSENGDHFEYEMYDLAKDPGQLVNLMQGAVSAESAKQANFLHGKLTEKMRRAGALPEPFLWPDQPILIRRR